MTATRADGPDRLRRGAEQLGLMLDDAVQARLLRYLDLLAQWNRVYNLTAVRDPGEMLTQHLLDSLAILPALRRKMQGAATRLLDVGIEAHMLSWSSE